MSLSNFLILLSGLCWTVVYLDGIRLGFRDRTYAIPFWALALNIAWEGLHAWLGYQHTGLSLQTVINAVWALFDVGILYTYFRFGQKWFPSNLPARWFVPWTLVALDTAVVVQVAFVLQFGVLFGRAYAAFLQNLLMSVLFIGMLVQRGSRDGQSLTIAVSKWLGTLAPTLLLGVIGVEDLGGPNRFILTVGLLCGVFDLLYIALLVQTKAPERRGIPPFGPTREPGSEAVPRTSIGLQRTARPARHEDPPQGGREAHALTVEAPSAAGTPTLRGDVVQGRIGSPTWMPRGDIVDPMSKQASRFTAVATMAAVTAADRAAH